MEVADIPENVDRRTLEDAMTLPTIEEARSWRGLMLVATGNEPVGRIDAVYVDRTTRQPEWALVHTGLFGSSRTFVPLIDAAKLGDTGRAADGVRCWPGSGRSRSPPSVPAWPCCGPGGGARRASATASPRPAGTPPPR